MRVILGIGNPGSIYSRTRHNVGFMFLDYLAARNSIIFQPSNFDYHFASGKIRNEEFLLVKPTTFVNNSGLAAIQLVEKYNLNLSALMVAVDDVNIGFSKFRIRVSGGDGGHNGLKSLIYHLRSDQFIRIRFGIGSVDLTKNLSEYVLSDFLLDEQIQLNEIFNSAASIVEIFIAAGIKAALDKNSNSNTLPN